MKVKSMNRLLAGIMCLIVIPALLLAGCDWGQRRHHTELTPRSSLLKDVDLTVRFSNTSALIAALEDSPMGQLWNSGAMAGFRNGRHLGEDILNKIGANSKDENAEKINAIDIEELKMLKGELILGFDFSKPGDMPGLSVIAAISDKDYQRSLELDRVQFELESEKTVVTRDTFGGIPILTYTKKEKSGDRVSYQAFYKGTMLVSEDRAWMERTLIVLKDKPAAEPDGDPVFSVSGTAQVIDRLKENLAETRSEGNSGLDPAVLFASLGLDTLGDFGLDVSLRKDRIDMTFKLARRGPWDHGLMVAFPQQAAPTDFRMAYVPPNPAGYQVSRFDLNALWIELPAILRQISPEMQSKFSMAVGALGGLMNINIGQDLFGNLDKLVFACDRMTDNRQQSLYGLLVKDPDAMMRTLEKAFGRQSTLAAKLGDLYRRTDIRGQIVHSIHIPVRKPGSDPGQVNEIGFAVVDRALLIGHAAMVTDYAQAAAGRSGQPEFYSRPEFKQLLAQVPANASGYGLSDLSQVARIVLTQIRQFEKAFSAMAAQRAPGDCNGRTQQPVPALPVKDFNFDRLPPDDVIAAHMGQGQSYSLIDASGMRAGFTLHYPKDLVRPN